MSQGKSAAHTPGPWNSNFVDLTGKVDPSGRIGVIAKTAIAGIEVPVRVHTKFYDFVAKGRIPAGNSIQEAFFRSCQVKIFPEMRMSICHVLKLKQPNDVWVRSRRFNETFTLIMIGEGMKLEEVCGFRALRQMGKAFLHYADDARSPEVQPEAERYHAIWKFKRAIPMGGGLLKQEKQPRDRWKKK